VHPYLRRRQGLEPVSYPSPELKAVLDKTLGVPLFQEQAMKIAIVAGGFTPGEADKLRRAMATFKRSGTIGMFKTKMIDGMVARNYPREFAERCFGQIEGFGEYGFPESHAASFALLVYASAWLKCRYPDVFAAALLNSQPMGFYAPAQIVRDLREHGVRVLPVDVNRSDWDATLEPDSHPGARVHALHRDMAKDICSTRAVRLGFRKIKGLSQREAKRIVAVRHAMASTRTPTMPFTSVRELWLRTGLSPRILERLADADAFGSLGLSRRQALWEAKALGRVGDKHDDLPLFRLSNNDAEQTSGEDIAEECVSSPQPANNAETQVACEPQVALPLMGLGEEVVNDYRFLELSLRAHPASFLRDDLGRRGIIRNADLRSRRSGEQLTVSGLVTIRQRPGTASGVIFMTIEDESAIANIIVWPKTFERFRAVVLGARYVAVSGVLQQESGVIHVVAEKLIDLTFLLAALNADAAPIESLARADAVKRPHDENVDSRARGRRNPARIEAPAALPEFASDLDVPAHGSAHVPARSVSRRVRGQR
jgi:error-prone DNA polymerase